MEIRDATLGELTVAEYLWRSQQAKRGRPPLVDISAWGPGQCLQTDYTGRGATRASASIRRQVVALGWRAIEISPQCWVRLNDFVVASAP